MKVHHQITFTMAAETKTAVLTIVRHGQSEANKKMEVQGWNNDTTLTDFGVKQAKAAGQALKDVKFHQAYSSDLKRAYKTCQIILDENQKLTTSVENIKQVKLLREFNFGVFEDKSEAEFRAEKEKYGDGFVPENGEGSSDVQNRAREFVKLFTNDIIIAKEEAPCILIVSHGGFIRELFTKIFFDEMSCCVPPNANTALPYDIIKNTCISKFEINVCTENHIIKTMKCRELCNAMHLSELV